MIFRKEFIFFLNYTGVFLLLPGMDVRTNLHISK